MEVEDLLVREAVAAGWREPRYHPLTRPAVLEGEATRRAAALAELAGAPLYVVHLTVILWWLLDKSPDQKATKELIAMLGRMLPMLGLTLRLDPARAWVRAADQLCREGLFGEAEKAPTA